MKGTHTYNSYQQARRIIALLTLLWMPFTAHAQFIQLQLDIPAVAHVGEVQPLALELLPDPETGLQSLRGTAGFVIAAAENMQLLLKVQAPDSLTNELNHSLPLQTKLAWRNDGMVGEPASQVNGSQAEFPVYNGGLLIDALNHKPALLYAYVYLLISCGLPQYPDTIYEANIGLTIEYN
jgi:hypothetical protein